MYTVISSDSKFYRLLPHHLLLLNFQFEHGFVKVYIINKQRKRTITRKENVRV